jgi:YceI-like domain
MLAVYLPNPPLCFDELDIQRNRYFVAHQHATRVQRCIPGDPKVLAIDPGRPGKANTVVAQGSVAGRSHRSSTKIRSKGGRDYEVTGDLTIRGVTKSVTLRVDVEVTAKRAPARKGVADGRRSVRFTREAHESSLEPTMEFLHERPRSCLANLTTQVSRLATDLTFNIVELSAPFDSLASEGRTVGHMGVVGR